MKRDAPRAGPASRSGARSPRGGELSGALSAVTGVFGRAANQVIALIITLLAARWLTPAIFGAFAIPAALVAFSRTVLYAGAYEYLLKAPEGEEPFTECLVVNLGLAAGMTVLLEGLAVFATPVFHTPLIGELLAILAPSCLLSAAANWQEAQLVRRGRIKSYYGVTTFAEVAAAAATMALILSGAGVFALVAQIYVRLLTLIATYRALQRPRWSPRFSMARSWEIARWSSHRYGTTVVNFFTNYSADFLLGAFVSPAATGLYRASHRMVTGVSDLITNPTRMMAVTLFSRRSAEGRPSGGLWPRVAAASAFLGWSALAGLAVISPHAVPFVLGAKWTDAAPIVAILCLQRALALIDGVTGPMMVAYNQARSLLGVQVAMAAASTALVVVTARFGVVAVAWSSVATAAVSLAACATLADRKNPGLIAGLPAVLPVGLGPALGSAGAAFVVDLLGRRAALAPAPALAADIGAGAFAFIAVVLAMRRPVVEVLQDLNPAPIQGAKEPSPPKVASPVDDAAVLEGTA